MRRKLGLGLDLIPCPKCLGVAEYVPGQPGDYPRSKCMSGEHEHALTPAVELHLRQMAALAQKRKREA